MSETTPSPDARAEQATETESDAATPASDSAQAQAQAPAPAPARPRRELLAWRNAVFVIFLLSGLSIASWVARVPTVRDDLGLELDAVGYVIFGISAGSIIGLVCSALLLARLGARHGMVLSLSLVAAGLVLVGVGTTLVPSAPLVFFGLAVFGFGNGSVDVMMNVEGAASEKEIRKTLMPLMHAFFSFGTVVGAGLGALASALEVPVFWHLSIIAALIVAVAVVAVRFVPLREELGDDTHGAESHKPWRTRLRENLAVWGDVRLLLIGVIMLGMSFAEGSANDWLALAVVDGHGMDNTSGALIFGVFVTSMAIGRIIGGPVLDRFGRVPVLRVCATIGVLGLLLFILGSASWMLVLGTVLWGLGCALGFPVGMSAAADDPRRAAARVSAVAVIGYCAFLVGPPLLGVLGHAFGILNALLVLLALMVLAGLCAPAARERRAA
ncbi:MFS transporter [Luethyella okanaganae]|uniref:MFS transporter n=1 Tax=Luethyella okanaganae TaxID=69372 RepID=A0ABW1VE61_9MICO